MLSSTYAYSLPSANEQQGSLSFAQVGSSPNSAVSGGRRRVTGAPSPQQVRRQSVETVPPISSPYPVKLAPSTVLSSHAAASISPVRRRVAGAPIFRKRSSPFAAAASVLHTNVNKSTEEKMEQFRREMDNVPTTPASPKSQKWSRVKDRVQWEEGTSCAVCMSAALTGRLKPCGHRSMCEACYEEVRSEGRGVYCPSCFQEATLLQSDSVSSNDSNASGTSGGSSKDEDDMMWSGGRRTNSSQASLHLMASRAGTKLDDPNILTTSASEIGDAFGTGIGVMFLHLGLMLGIMFLLTCLQIPSLAGNSAGQRTKVVEKEKPNIFVSTTLGNCGVTSCSIDGKWYVVIADAAAMILIGLLSIWVRAYVVYFELYQINDQILKDAKKTMLVESCHAGMNATMLKEYFKGVGSGLLRVDMLSEVEAMELDLMQRRRSVAMKLRIANAMVEWGDPTSECSGECISEEEWGHMMVPKMERKMDNICHVLTQLENTPSSMSNAFLWFNTARDRDHAAKELMKLNEIQSVDDLWKKEAGRNKVWDMFERCIGCNVAGKSFPLAGTSSGDGIRTASCSVHPGLFPANLVHRNMTVTSGQRLAWRLGSVLLLIVAVGVCTAIYASTIKTSRFLTAALLLVVNTFVPVLVTYMVRQQRAYLRTEESDVICFLSFLVVSSNVLYFTLYSAFYPSRDGGLARWEHLFTLEWYQRGGGDVLHYYVLLDAVLSPVLIAMRTGNQRMTRSKKVRKAVCQEQLNSVHVGIELDYLCEYSMALVCPAMSIVLCCGLPMLPCLAGVGLCVKYCALKHVLFYESAVPLWRDSTIVKWGGWIMQIAVLAHFLFASAMLVSANQIDFEISGSTGVQEYAVGLYAIHPLAFVGVAVCMCGANCVTSCMARCSSNRNDRKEKKNSTILATKIERERKDGQGAADGGRKVAAGEKLPSGKLQRDAIEKIRQERRNGSGNDHVSGSDDSDEGNGGGGGSGMSGSESFSDDDGSEDDDDSDDVTNTSEKFTLVLKKLDQQAERAWGVDLVVNPAEINSFDAGQHPYFGAEIQLRRSMRKKKLIAEGSIGATIAGVAEDDDEDDDEVKQGEKSAIRAKIDKRRRISTGSKKKATDAVNDIKDKLSRYVDRAKRKKAHRLAKKQETSSPKKRTSRARVRAGNHIV